MKTHATVLHVADVHLGNLQYHLTERHNDFATAFSAIVDDAVQRRVDTMLVAGDVFHKRSIDAQTLFQAREMFTRLRQAGIPAIVIEGNHDKAFYRDSNVSWLNFLAWSGDIILLAPTQGDEGVHFAPWSSERGEGGCYDIPDTGIRVYGIPWFGGATALMMQRAAEALRAARDEDERQGVRFRMLMLHTGVEGEVPALHGLPRREQFAPLHDLVDYIALGHVHKPYHHDNWLFNPGSIETVSAEEAEWKRGYYIVDIDLEGTPRFHAQHIPNRQRPFLRWTFSVDGMTSPEALVATFRAWVGEHATQAERSAERFGGPPVVDISLRGQLEFTAEALDARLLEGIVRDLLHPLHVILRAQYHTLDFAPDLGDVESRDDVSRPELELTVLRELVSRDARYASDPDRWARVVAELKARALAGNDPAGTVDWLHQMLDRAE